MSALKILSFSPQYLLHDEFFYVVLLVCNVREPILGSLFWGAIIADRSYLFMVIIDFCLMVAARARAWLPLALLVGALLSLWAIVSNVSQFCNSHYNRMPDLGSW